MPLLSETAYAVVRHFFLAYPGRTALMVVLMFLAGIAEGVGVITLIPLLEVASQGSGEVSDLGRAILGVLDTLHLDPVLGTLLGVIFVAILVKAVMLLFAQRQIGYAVAQVTTDMRLELMRNLLSARWSFFGRKTTGQFANAVTTEAPRAGQVYSELCQILAAILQMLAYALAALLISWWITVGAVILGVGLTFLAQGFFVKTWRSGVVQTSTQKNLASVLVDVLQGIKALKAMAKEHLVWPLLEREAQDWNEAKRIQISTNATLKAFHEPVLTLFLAIGLFIAIDIAGQPLSATIVLAFVFYRLFVHVGTLQMRYQLVLAGVSAFDSLQAEVREAGREREEQGNGELFTGLKDAIRLEEVAFGYGREPIFEGVSVEIPAGSFVAIHGESGTGKTTLADLIVGLHQPLSGRILIDGVPLNELDLRSWRQSIGYVPQEILLFNESVFLNVTLGDPRYTRADAERALRLADAWDFVAEKGGGLDHHIGDRGGLLSGGQRQRIAIARALVGSPSLLILDEATTALDPATEQAICQTLGNLRHKVTVLSISHQTAMREVADTVFQMRYGHLTLLDPASVHSGPPGLPGS